MAKLTRQTLKLFGSSGATADFAKFGSQAATAPVKTKDISVIQALAAWDEGWQDAVAIGEAPYLEDMNGLLYVHSYEAVYNFQEGVAEWDTGTNYFIGGVVKYLGNAGYVEFYASRIDNNLANAPSTRVTDANWSFLYALSLGSGLIIPGTTTDDDAGAGDVGYAPRSYVAPGAAVSLTVSNQFYDITSIALGAGDWDISGVACIQLSGSSMTTSQGVVSENSGTDATDHLDGDNLIQAPPPTSGYYIGMTIPTWRLKLAAPGNAYLKAAATHGAGTPTGFGRISARRAR